MLTSAATLMYLGGLTAAISPSRSASPSSLEPIKPPAAAYFNVTLTPRRVRAGEDANITVTIALNDRPRPGAAVRLAMLFTPGTDYRFVPASGLTDAQGVFRARVKTSRNPGESVVAATSGVFSDQDQVVGSAPSGGSAAAVAPGHATAPGRGLVPLLVLGVLAVVLVALGIHHFHMALHRPVE